MGNVAINIVKLLRMISLSCNTLLITQRFHVRNETVRQNLSCIASINSLRIVRIKIFNS